MRYEDALVHNKIEVLDELPLTAMQKVDRRLLSRLVAEQT